MTVQDFGNSEGDLCNCALAFFGGYSFLLCSSAEQGIGKCSSFKRMVSPAPCWAFLGHDIGWQKSRDQVSFHSLEIIRKISFYDQLSDKIEILANPSTVNSKRSSLMGANPVATSRNQMSVQGTTLHS